MWIKALKISYVLKFVHRYYMLNFSFKDHSNLYNIIDTVQVKKKTRI